MLKAFHSFQHLTLIVKLAVLDIADNNYIQLSS